MIKIFQILYFDLIMYNKALNKITCITHFINELIFFNLIFLLMNYKKNIIINFQKFNHLM